jgi:hypothetical protein
MEGFTVAQTKKKLLGEGSSGAQASVKEERRCGGSKEEAGCRVVGGGGDGGEEILAMGFMGQMWSDHAGLTMCGMSNKFRRRPRLRGQTDNCTRYTSSVFVSFLAASTYLWVAQDLEHALFKYPRVVLAGRQCATLGFWN